MARKEFMNIKIIAEIGQNYNGDMGLAKDLICAAKDSGADVAKFQLFDGAKLFPKENNEWYEYNCKNTLSRNDLFKLNEICIEYKIEFMASVFDVERVDWLEEINVKEYKIASRSINDKFLISRLMNTKKSIIASLGMWSKDYFPIELEKYGASFLYCVSNYPTKINELNFSKVNFNSYAGFSDHTIGINAALVAMSRGAKIIEKHFTLNKKMYGPDHSCSMTPDELQEINKFRIDLLAAF